MPVVRTWLGYIANQGPIVRGIDYDTGSESTGVAYLHLRGPGAPVNIQSDSAQVRVPALGVGENFTALLKYNQSPVSLNYTRTDGSHAKFLGLPFPDPAPGERYTLYGNKMVLIGSNLTQLQNQTVLTLKWIDGTTHSR